MFVMTGTRSRGAPVVLMADLVTLAVDIFEATNGVNQWCRTSCANSRRPNTHKSAKGGGTRKGLKRVLDNGAHPYEYRNYRAHLALDRNIRNNNKRLGHRRNMADDPRARPM